MVHNHKGTCYMPVVALPVRGETEDYSINDAETISEFENPIQFKQKQKTKNK